jgi:hypothetical protein
MSKIADGHVSRRRRRDNLDLTSILEENNHTAKSHSIDTIENGHSPSAHLERSFLLVNHKNNTTLHSPKKD